MITKEFEQFGYCKVGIFLFKKGITYQVMILKELDPFDNCKICISLFIKDTGYISSNDLKGI